MGGIAIPFLRRFSYAGDGSSLYQETSFVVPLKTTAAAAPPPIPTITFTCHDSSEDLKNSWPPEIQISGPESPMRCQPPPPPPAPAVSASQLPTNILIPQLIVSCDDLDGDNNQDSDLIWQQKQAEIERRHLLKEQQEKELQELQQHQYELEAKKKQPQPQKKKVTKSNSMGNGSTRSKWRPPPIQIPNSNFLRRRQSVATAAAAADESKNGTKDTSSMPREIEIELEEMQQPTVTTTTQPSPTPNQSSHSSTANSSVPYKKSEPLPVTMSWRDSKQQSSPLTPPPPRSDSSSSSSPTPLKRRTSLVKQKEAIENREEEEKEITLAKEVIVEQEQETSSFYQKQTSVESEGGSPKYLLNPESFDSAPRMRSQSITLPEFTLEAKKDDSGSGRLVIQSTKDAILNPALKEIQVQLPSTPKIIATAAIPPRTRDERLALLLRQRSLTGSGIPTTCTTAQSTKYPKSSSDDPNASWKGIKLGSPTLKRDPPSFPQVKLTAASGGGGDGPTMPMATPGAFPPRGSCFRNYDKPQSLDLPGLAPAITITPMSELESDGDSPVIKVCPAVSTAATSSMHYLSPFTTIHTCGSRTTSESNLSSSGYSSMASPGPSRSGSSNPLCISESEDTSSTPTSSSGFFSCSSSLGVVGMASCIVGGASGVTSGSGGMGGYIPQGVFMRRPSPLLKSPSVDSESSDPAQPNIPPLASAARRIYSLRKMQERAFRYR